MSFSTHQTADASDLYKLTNRLQTLTQQLEKMAPDIAAAKQIDRYDSDRRKNLLAEYTEPLLSDRSSAAAETIARANAQYKADLQRLSQELLAALTTLARADALQAQFEATRSILSSVKAQMNL